MSGSLPEKGGLPKQYSVTPARSSGLPAPVSHSAELVEFRG